MFSICFPFPMKRSAGFQFSAPSPSAAWSSHWPRHARWCHRRSRSLEQPWATTNYGKMDVYIYSNIITIDVYILLY